MISDDSLPLIETRTAAEVDDSCGMKYWWNFEEAGTGIVPVNPPEYFADGKNIHEDVELIASLDDKELTPEGIQEHIEVIAASTPTKKQSEAERLQRRLGWFAAFALFLEPSLRQEFETISVEADITLDRDPLWIPITPDRLLRHRQGGYLVYKEWKSTITAGPKWMASWPFSIQLHIGMKAIEEEIGEKVAYSQIVGFIKGDKRGDHLSHPYVWAWRNSKTGAWTSDYNKARSADWEKAPLWEYEGGVVQWVTLLGKEVALDQFPHSYPVFLNNRMLEDWVSRRNARQTQIEEKRDLCQHDWNERVLYFEPRTRNCRPAFGDECPFLRCCWNAEINQNPLASDQFVRRTPHHELEIIGVQ